MCFYTPIITKADGSELRKTTTADGYWFTLDSKCDRDSPYCVTLAARAFTLNPSPPFRRLCRCVRCLTCAMVGIMEPMHRGNQQHSSDKPELDAASSGPSDLRELTALRPNDLASGGGVKLIEDTRIRVQVMLDEWCALPRIKEVAFEALDSSGGKIATYRTIGPIHIMTSRSVLGYMMRADEQGLNAAAKARLIYDCLTKSSAIKFETIPEPAEKVSGQTAKMPPVYRVIPRLDQFIRDPGIIDEQFGGHWTNGDIVTRLSAVLQPKAGFAIVSVKAEDTAQGKVWDWTGKFLAPADPTMSANEVKRFLVAQARQAFTHVCTEGIEGLVAHLEDSDSADCQFIETNFEDRELLDRRILAGDISEIHCIEKQLDSGAVASLVMGQTCAAISVAAAPEELTSRLTVLYSHTDPREQLTSWQIHYIRDAYEKLTSNDPDEQHAGIKQALSIQEFFPEASSSCASDKVNSNALSYKDLTIKAVETDYTIRKLLGEEFVGMVEYLPGVEYIVAPRYFDHALRDCIQGRWRLTVRREDRSVRALREHPEHFREMEFLVSNDGSLYVMAKNGAGSRLATEIGTASLSGGGARATMVHLIQLFANQSKESWSTLLSAINQLRTIANQGFYEESELVTVNDFPSSDDIEGIELFEKATSIYAWLLTEHEYTFPRAHVRYVGGGRVELEIKSFNDGPGFRFLLERGIIRQLAVLKRVSNWTEKTLRHEVCAVFNSETLTIESDEAREILDACSTVQHYTKNSFLAGDTENRLTKSMRILHETLRRSMNIGEGLFPSES